MTQISGTWQAIDLINQQTGIKHAISMEQQSVK